MPKLPSQLGALPPSAPQLHHLLTFSVGGAPAGSISPGPFGDRTISRIDGGGTFFGGRLSGTVDSFGGSWGIFLPTGTRIMDTRLLLHTEDGADIYLALQGLGRRTSETEQDFRALAFFEAGDDRYLWLNETVALARGRSIAGSGVYRYDLFEIA